MSDSKTAEQLAGEVKGVLDARFGEVKSSLEAKQAELRGVLDARHNEIRSDLEGKHDKVKALAEEALGKAQRGEDLSNATKELADEALTALNEAKARLDEVEQKLARRVADDVIPEFKTIGEQVVADEAIKAFLGNNTVRGRASVEVKAIISALTTDANGSAGDLIVADRIPGIVIPGQRRLTVRDLPSVRPHWKQELDHLRVNLEAGGCPYVTVAPILQSIYLNERIFAETKCIKVTLGAPTSLASSAEDGLPFENISEIAEEKQRWHSEGERLHVDAEAFKLACTTQLGLDVETVRASGEFALIKGRWFPTVLIFLRDAKSADGSPIDWPLDGKLVDLAVKAATAETGRRWANWTFGGVPEEAEEVDVEAVYKSALNGDLAAQVQLAQILYRGEKVERDLSTALQWFRKAASQGHGESQAMVAYMLDEGLGCAQNEVEGLHWHRLAAENGSAYSQRKLAAAYEAGELLRQDYGEAAKWYRLAADQGSPDAQFSLGWLLYSGNGVPQNLEEAAEYFERSALQGNAAAQYNIAAMYGHGEHAPADRVKSYAWLRLAAEQEYEGAEGGIEEICSRMSADEMAKGKELAKELAATIGAQR